MPWPACAPTAPDGTSVVVVADGPSSAQAVALEALEAGQAEASATLPTEVIWTSERLGHAAATNIGVRRAGAPVVVLLDTSVEPTGDVVTPLVARPRRPDGRRRRWLGDRLGATCASSRMHRLAMSMPIEGYVMAFRRADFAARGPLDERFRFYRNLDIWWSLVLRDEGEDRPPRRAVSLDGLPVVRHEHRGYTSLPDDERDRQSKRNFYRIIDRFGWRRDLLVSR